MLAYVRGRGWVEETNVITMACGTRVRIEMRAPDPGERWDAGSILSMNEWCSVEQSILYHQACDYNLWAGYHLYPGETVVTLIPC